MERPKLKPVVDLLFVFVLSFAVGVVATIALLYDVVVKGPSAAFGKRKRNVRPEVLAKPVYGSHEFIRLQNVRLKLHCVINGPADKPVMVFLHGFPEFWYSWRYQLKEFSKDYRTVAVDMRGYGESDRPSGIHQYTLDHLVEDVDQLLDGLGAKKCVLVGHDWGGAVAWCYAALHPDRVDKLIVGNCPHLAAFQTSIKSSFAQLRKSWYMFFTQVPVLSNIIFHSFDMKLLDDVFCGRQVGAKRGTFTTEDIEAFKYTFADHDDVRGPMNYNRALLRYQSPQVEGVLAQKMTTPSLLIWGTNDGALDLALAELSRQYVDNLTVRYMEGTSHWVQQEEPEQFNALVRQFLSQ